MHERRMSNRNLIHMNVDLYHHDIGNFEGNIRDVSSGGMSIEIHNYSVLNTKYSHEVFTVKPANMDVLFNMECLRVDGGFMSLKFVD